MQTKVYYILYKGFGIWDRLVVVVVVVVDEVEVAIIEYMIRRRPMLSSPLIEYDGDDYRDI